ncbi:glucose-6-phosphate isomerase, partial [Klebsiella pneumoniae]
AVGPATEAAAVATTGPLGAQFLLWEYAVAVVGKLLRINPFDQPDVEAAKKAARALLDNPQALTTTEGPSAVIGPVEVYGPVGEAAKETLTEVLREFVDGVADGGYIAVQAYLDRLDDASATLLRSELARRTGKQATFGWGPRFLHSTGQYHKGGHPNGSFLQITGAVEEDVPVPDRPYTLGKL